MSQQRVRKLPQLVQSHYQFAYALLAARSKVANTEALSIKLPILDQRKQMLVRRLTPIHYIWNSVPTT